MLVFVPSEDGTQVDVLFLNVPHGHQISDNTALAHHMPMLLARAGNCTGDCTKRVAAVASYLFGDLPTDSALDATETAVAGGAVWPLDQSDLSIRKGSPSAPDLPALSINNTARTSIVPTTSAERASYVWVASFKQLCPECEINAALLGDEPPSNLVVARLRLRSGNLFTYQVAKIGANVTPVSFKRVDGQGNASGFTQSISSWIGADIAVSGSDIEIVETKFDGSAGRSIKLTPDQNGRIELVLANLPELVPATPSGIPGIGKHFQRLFDVMSNAPSAAARYVPQAGAAPGAPSYPTVSWGSVHPNSELWSDLLNAIRLYTSRSAYEVVLCPPASTQP